MSTITLTWTLPTTNSDGTAILPLTGIHVWDTGYVIATLPGTATSYAITNATPGIHNIGLTVVDNQNRLSPLSVTASTTVPTPPPIVPNPPTGLTAVVS